jgi:hypothetical protein
MQVKHRGRRHGLFVMGIYDEKVKEYKDGVKLLKGMSCTVDVTKV